MSDDPTFYDILEQTKYHILISRPAKMEELSDLFITEEEVTALTGNHFYHPRTGDTRRVMLDNVISTEVMTWADKLIASGKKTLRIDDEDLLDVLKRGYLSDHTEGDNRFGRHGDRICYARQFKRKKTKPTQGDVTNLWSMMFWGFRDKFDTYPSHVPKYDRGTSMFKAFKSIVGWRRTRAHMHNKELVKFYRQIWDNPEEHIK